MDYKQRLRQAASMEFALDNCGFNVLVKLSENCVIRDLCKEKYNKSNLF